MGKNKANKTVEGKFSGRKKLIIGAIVVVLIIIAVAVSYSANMPVGKTQKLNLKTSQGNVVIEVYPEEMPVTVNNFTKLVKNGFYNELTFHRAEDWVIQGGDPKGNGTGGPGWTIPLETTPKLKNVRGAVAMARGLEPDSAGSQFYILKKDAAWLDGQYAVFGKVVKGMEVVDKIKAGDKIISIRELTGEAGK